jgi:hypothetical protein
MRSLFAALMFLSSNAFALTCIAPSLDEQYRSSTHVVLVKITDARIEDAGNRPLAGPPRNTTSTDIEITNDRVQVDWRRLAATVNILEMFKGENPPTKLVFTSWGYQPQVRVGANYLVFLDGPNVSLDCGESRSISASNPEHVHLLEQLRTLAR